jgi:outer membrane protein, heavy metal efflux system
MKILLMTVTGCCLVAGGCASPIDRSWNEPLAASDSFDRSDARAVEPLAQMPGDALARLESLETLSLDDAILLGIAGNPLLKRAGYQVEVADGQVIQAGLYPNPLISFDGEGLGAGAGSGGETIYRVEQEIVLGGKIGRARAVAESDRLGARAALVSEEFAVASRVTRSYFAAAAANERLKNRQELLDLSDELLKAAATQVDAGSATEPDRLRAEVVWEQAAIELDAARLAAVAARQTLASAIGLEAPVLLPLTTKVDGVPQFSDLESFVASVLDANSRIEIARISIERARRAHELARAQAMPNLVASIGPRYSDIDNETTVDLGLGMRVPLFDRNQGNIRSALAERLSAGAELRAVQLELLSEVSQAWAAYDAARMATTRYREQLLPKAERTLDMTRQMYERGKTGYLRLLDAQQVVIESRIAYVDSLERLQEAAALLRELAQTDTPWHSPGSGNPVEMETTP